MKIVIAGKQIDLGDALRQHVTERLEAGVGKYFDSAIEANVVISREGHMIHTECAVHVGAGISALANGEDTDVYASTEAAIVRLEKQLRRDKRKRRNHHAGPRVAADSIG